MVAAFIAASVVCAVQRYLPCSSAQRNGGRQTGFSGSPAIRSAVFEDGAAAAGVDSVIAGASAAAGCSLLGDDSSVAARTLFGGNRGVITGAAVGRGPDTAAGTAGSVEATAWLRARGAGGRFLSTVTLR